MVKKKNNTLFYVLGIFIFLIFIGMLGQTQGPDFDLGVDSSTSTSTSSINDVAEHTDFISVRLYDKNGNIIQTINPNTLSIVTILPSGTPTSGVSAFDLTITVSNIGTEVLTCDLISSSPIALTTALGSPTTRVINPSTITAWTSGQISANQFGQPAPAKTTFTASIDCFYNPGTGPVQVTGSPKVGTLEMTIESDLQGDFTVTVTSGGQETLFCGDNICSSSVGEDSIICPADCPLPSQPIYNFRTSDTSYVSGSAIGYISSCSATGTMTLYGRVNSGVRSGVLCNARTDVIQPSLLIGLPGTFASSPSGSPKLYQDLTDPNKLWVCQDRTDGNSQHVVYDTSSSTSALTITDTVTNTGKEVQCGTG